MCVISMIMIALCIPNQIQIANAESETDEIIVKDSDGEWKEAVWTTNFKDTSLKTLNIFPEAESGKYWNVEPGDIGNYVFSIENDTSDNRECTIKIESENGKEYPIEYQLYNQNDGNKNLLGESDEWKNPTDETLNFITCTDKVESGETEDYTLMWRFRETNSNYEKGTYRVNIKVASEKVKNSDDNNKPVNPDDDKKDDNKGDNNNSTDNGNSGNNSSNNNGSNNGNNTSNNNKGNNATNNNNQNNKQNNLNIDKTSSKRTGSTVTNKKKVNTSDITTPVIYVAFMILMFGLILLVKSRKEN